MAVELNENVVTAKTIYTGDDGFAVIAGQSLLIETSPDGEEIFDSECPEGKVWAVTVFVKIEETDA